MADKAFGKEAVLKPSTMATVAERRFADAEALVRTRQNARANGAVYLVGFAIEILLKAQLVRKFSVTAKKRSHEVANDERKVWNLIWRSHDLEAMLAQLAEIEGSLKKRGERDGHDYVAELKKLFPIWTIQARYSSHTILMDEARRVLETVRSLKELLK